MRHLAVTSAFKQLSSISLPQSTTLVVRELKSLILTFFVDSFTCAPSVAGTRTANAARAINVNAILFIAVVVFCKDTSKNPMETVIFVN